MTTSTTAVCHFCPTELTGPPVAATARINGNHWTGTEYVRVDLCGGCFSAGRLAKHPRKPRRRRQAPQYAASDWNMLVAFSGRGRA